MDGSPGESTSRNHCLPPLRRNKILYQSNLQLALLYKVLLLDVLVLYLYLWLFVDDFQR